MTENDNPIYVDQSHRYRLDSRIATGGMGVVWKATDTRLNRTVAVKVLKHEYADDDTFRARFESEARSAAALHHPGIAGVFDYSTEGSSESGAPFLVMEYVDGEPLSALLSRAKEAGRPLDSAIVTDLIAQTADALAVAHAAGIVHRDIKPANLLITPDRKVKITDFGIARAGDATAITRTGAVMGTPQYLSPEQARGNPSTPASDVYSLGVVAFECLSGRRPFEAETPVATVLAHLQQPVPDLPEEVPADLAAVVKRAMAKEPGDRFSDGAAFAAALRDPSGAGAISGPATAVLPQTGVLPVPGTGPIEDVGRLDPVAAYEGEDAEEDEKGSFPWGVLIAVILLVLGIVLVAWLLLRGDDPEEEDTTRPTRSTETTASSSPTEASTTPTTEDATTTLDANDYIGRDYRDVEDELSDLGFQVRLEEAANDGSREADIVSAVNPSGTVNEGELITVTYWGPAPEPTTEPTSEATSETTSEAPSETSSAAEESTSAEEETP
ncbi:protein kinase domain-containing protein [Nocardioides sambongensis]|uniref:protein kinase domain-containing protein n=1 Tax=Nocardioides sambongensis TaxID=2589074 RepID=UPI0011283CC3|nr:protein kinase [Nocardioides sambongensis]